MFRAGGWTASDGWGRQGITGDGRGQLRTAGDCRRRPVMVRDGGGLRGTARVMSHEVKRTRLEVYDLNLASTGGPSPRTIFPYSPSGPHLPERSASQHPQKDGL